MAVNNLSAFQQFLSTKFPGKNAKFNDAQLRAAADEFFGPIPVPPGSTIVSQDGGQVIYKDAEGYTHTASRSLDGRDPNAGVVKDNTDRPNILPPTQTATPQQTALSDRVGGVSSAQLANIEALARGERPKAFDPGIDLDLERINTLANTLQQGPQLGNLDPQTAAALKAISDAEQMRLKEQFDQQSGSAIAQLYGNRVNQSSIAGQNIGQLQQAQGLVSAQQGADAANRQLTVQQFLTQQQQQQRELALQALLGGTGAKLEGFNATNAASQAQSNSLLDLLKELSGQQTQRDIATAQIGLGDRELSERARQANQGFELGQQDADLRLKEANSTFNKILQGLNTGANLAGAIGGGISAFSALKNKRTTPGV